jgi:hypothetical protein
MIGEAVENLALDAIVKLYAAHRDGEDAVWVMPVPYQAQADRATAIRVFDRVVANLRARGVPLEVRVTNVAPGLLDSYGVPTVGGQLFGVILDQDELDRRDAAEED